MKTCPARARVLCCVAQEFLSLGVLSLTITLGLFFVKDASTSSSGISPIDRKVTDDTLSINASLRGLLFGSLSACHSSCNRRGRVTNA